MKIRKLKGKDLFKFTKILRKLGVKDEIKGVISGFNAKGKKKNEILEQLGTDVIFTIIERLDLAETEISEFMGELLGMKAEEWLDLELEEMMESFRLLLTEDGFASFFKQAAK